MRVTGHHKARAQKCARNGVFSVHIIDRTGGRLYETLHSEASHADTFEVNWRKNVSPAEKKGTKRSNRKNVQPPALARTKVKEARQTNLPTKSTYSEDELVEVFRLLCDVVKVQKSTAKALK